MPFCIFSANNIKSAYPIIYLSTIRSNCSLSSSIIKLWQATICSSPTISCPAQYMGIPMYWEYLPLDFELGKQKCSEISFAFIKYETAGLFSLNNLAK